jgi:hypothetical protein
VESFDQLGCDEAAGPRPAATATATHHAYDSVFGPREGRCYATTHCDVQRTLAGSSDSLFSSHFDGRSSGTDHVEYLMWPPLDTGRTSDRWQKSTQLMVQRDRGSRSLMFRTESRNAGTS